MNKFVIGAKKPQKDASNKIRRKIIALFAKMGYLNDDGSVDMGRIYAWVKKYGYLKKNLNEYTQKELPVLVTQSEKVYISIYRIFVEMKPNLFTNKTCDYCCESKINPRNPGLFHGFRDLDTKQLVCRSCRMIHYQKQI